MTAVEVGDVNTDEDAALLAELTAFVSREAMLLDDDRLEEWETLFASGGHYWIPLAHGQTDPLNHASIAYEDAILRDVRIRRLREARAWSQQPITRSSRVIGHLILIASNSSEITVRAPFQMTEWRKRRDQRLLAGHYTWTFRRVAGSWKILLKRVDLINCDGVHDNFEVFV